MKFKPVEILSHIVLILGVLLMVLPIWYSFATSTHENVAIMTEGMKFFLGDSFSQNYNEVLNEKGGWSEEVTAAKRVSARQNEAPGANSDFGCSSTTLPKYSEAFE